MTSFSWYKYNGIQNFIPCRPCCHGQRCLYPWQRITITFFKKGFKYRLHSRIAFTKCMSIVEEALQTYCKRWCKKEGVGVHALNDWKNEFLRIVDIRIENVSTYPHLYKQPPRRSVQALKRKLKNYTVNMSLSLPTKQQITSSLSEKDTTWMFWRGNWILRVHMYLLSWRKTNFFCIISILSLNQKSKLIELTCLHFIGCRNYTNILINHASYQILVIALLPSNLSI